LRGARSRPGSVLIYAHGTVTMDMMVNRRILRIFTALVMALTMTSVSVLCSLCGTSVYADPDEPSQGITVYVTISDDSEFVTGRDGDSTVLARVPVKLTYEDLADYGLAEYKRYEAYDFDDGGDYIPGSAEIKEPTVLMLMLKAVASYYYGDPERKDFVPGDGFTCEGGAMHLFITRFFGHDLNLMYFVNHEFPRQNKTSGATADYVLLSENDEVDIAMFTDYDFNKHGGFARFADTQQDGKTGREITNTLMYTPTVIEDEQAEQAETDLPMAGEKIRISKDHGRTWQDSGCVTDENGEFNITFYEPGEYLMSAGPKYKYMEDRDIQKACIAPPIATVKIEQAVPSDAEKAKEQEDRGETLTLISETEGFEDSIKNAKAECSSLTGEYETLRESVLAAKAEYDAVKDSPTQAAVRAAESYKERALEAKAKADELTQKAEAYKHLAEEYEAKAKQAELAAEAWRKSAAVVSQEKYQDAKAAYDKSKEAVSSAADSLSDAGDTVTASAAYGSEASDELGAAEEALADAIKAKEEADAQKSKEEKAADDLEDAKELLGSYNTAKSSLQSCMADMDAQVSAYKAQKKQVETLIGKAKKDLSQFVPGTKVNKNAAEAKKAAAGLTGYIDGLGEKVQAAKAAMSEAEKVSSYLGDAAGKALESNSEISEEKKAKAQAIVDSHSEAVEYLGKTGLEIDDVEALQSTEPDAIDKLIRDAEAIYRKIVDKNNKASKAISAAAKLKVKNLKARSNARKITVSWKKTKGAAGYQVQYKLKSAKKFKTLKKLSKTKVKTKKLKKGKKYQFRVRTYTKIYGKLYYGKWTAVKTVKCK